MSLRILYTDDFPADVAGREGETISRSALVATPPAAALNA